MMIHTQQTNKSKFSLLTTTTLLALLCAAAFAQEKSTFKDARDGKSYKTVKIGGQVWMAENLDYGGEDGDIGVCPDSEPKNCPKYGRLYNWENAMVACPDGWHLPLDEEWQTLVAFAGGGVAGQKLKARTGWEKWDCELTQVDDRGRTKKVSKCNSDSYGFSALPSSSKNTFADWWTATESYYGNVDAYMLHNSTEVKSNNNYSKSKTLSVRCLKGEGKLPAKFAEKKIALATAEATKKAEKIAEAANPLTTEVTEEGTILRGSNLAKKLAWLNRSAESHNTYIIEVNANENIAPHVFEYKGAINITIILRGDNENRTLRLSTHGNMFTIHSNVTLVLDNNITLQGHNQNTGALIIVENGGILIMNDGVTIIGNIRSTKEDTGGGGVHIKSKGTFTMNGGTISGNTVNYGGGVYNYYGTFTMNGGAISGNASNYGGGVYNYHGTFTMNSGTIFGNAANYGGGVYSSDNGIFTMRSGTISGNTASINGGGVYTDISSYVQGVFTKTSGTITGYNSDQNNGNTVKDEEGVLARRGHAVYNKGKEKRKETTAGPDDDLSCNRNSCTGVWDD